MTPAQREDRAQTIGRALLASLNDLKHVQCPRCGRETLDAELENDKAVVIACSAPSERVRAKDGLCGYRRVVDAVRLAELPSNGVDSTIPVFTERPRLTLEPAKAGRRRVRTQ